MTLTCIQRRIIDYSMMVIHQTSLVNGKEHTLWCSAGANDSSLTLILRVQCKEHPTCVRRTADKLYRRQVIPASDTVRSVCLGQHVIRTFLCRVQRRASIAHAFPANNNIVPLPAPHKSWNAWLSSGTLYGAYSLLGGIKQGSRLLLEFVRRINRGFYILPIDVARQGTICAQDEIAFHLFAYSQNRLFNLTLASAGDYTMPV